MCLDPKTPLKGSLPVVIRGYKWLSVVITLHSHTLALLLNAKCNPRQLSMFLSSINCYYFLLLSSISLNFLSIVIRAKWGAHLRRPLHRQHHTLTHKRGFRKTEVEVVLLFDGWRFS